MKTPISFIAFFLFIVQTSFCQSLHIDSTRFITGTACCTEITFTIQTQDKGILFVGNDYGNPGGIIPFFPTDLTSENVLVGKIDSNRQISWIKVFGGSNVDHGISACETVDGGYAVLAGTLSSNGDITGFKGGQDLWLLRLDATGHLQWEKTYGSTGGDEPISIAKTKDNGFVLLGASNGSDGDVPFHYGGMFAQDWVVIKTDSNGAVQWSKVVGGTGDEQTQGTILAVDTNYYLISSSTSADHDCTDSFWHTGLQKMFYSYYVIKLNSNGAVLWDSSYGGSGDDVIASAHYDYRDNSVVIAGSTSSNDYMVSGYHGGDYDIWVIKVRADGKLLWQKTFGSANDDRGTDVCLSRDGGYLAYGWTHDGVIGQELLWLFALDSSGNELVDKQYGGPRYTTNISHNCIPFQNGFVVTGEGGSSLFSEGTTYGNFDSVGGAFISYIDFTPLVTDNVHPSGQNKINIFPNPAADRINVSLPRMQQGRLIILNRIGQTVHSERIQTKTTLINIQDWPRGMYIAEWIDDDGTVTTNRFIRN